MRPVFTDLKQELDQKMGREFPKLNNRTFILKIYVLESQKDRKHWTKKET